KVTRRFLLPPADGVDHYRYVMDVAAQPGGAASVSEAKLASSQAKLPAGAPAALKLRGQLPARRPDLLLKKVVVIDAGHGGHEPGAQGAEGHEKDVNLAAAQALKARLERTGRYKVVMT